MCRVRRTALYVVSLPVYTRRWRGVSQATPPRELLSHPGTALVVLGSISHESLVPQSRSVCRFRADKSHARCVPPKSKTPHTPPCAVVRRGEAAHATVLASAADYGASRWPGSAGRVLRRAGDLVDSVAATRTSGASTAQWWCGGCVDIGSVRVRRAWPMRLLCGTAWLKPQLSGGSLREGCLAREALKGSWWGITL